jgi:hypothetical protein
MDIIPLVTYDLGERLVIGAAELDLREVSLLYPTDVFQMIDQTRVVELVVTIDVKENSNAPSTRPMRDPGGREDRLPELRGARGSVQPGG